MDDKLKKTLQNLDPEQLKNLLNKSKGKVDASSPAVEKMPRNVREEYPLSKNQERIWFLSRISDHSLYNIPYAIIRNDIKLDISQFQDAINKLILENDILRTTFHEKDGELLQKIHSDLKIDVLYEDIRNDNKEDNEHELLNEIGIKHSNIRFNLEQLPLISVKVVRIRDTKYGFFFNLHHLISDGWTNALIAKEINAYYKDIFTESKSKLQYIDFVHYEKFFLQSDEYNKKMRFWKELLSPLPDRLRFPADYNTEGQSSEGRLESYELPDPYVNELQEFCFSENISQFQFYILVYAILIQKYTGKQDLIIGTPASNRRNYFHNTYGLFFNSLPIRFFINEDSSFRELIREHKARIDNALDAQEVPFSEIIREVDPVRNENENALFNVHFAYQHFPQRDKADEHNLLKIDYGKTKFDINFWVEVTSQKSNILLTYKNDRISKSKIQQFIRHYVLLSQKLIATPSNPIKDIRYISQTDASHLEGEHLKIDSETIVDLFRQKWSENYDMKAIQTEGESMTYMQLDSRATSIAFGLKENGVKKGDVVVLGMGRKIDYIAAIIACFKLGVTYLPVSKKIDKGRLNYIIDDSSAKVILGEFTDLNCTVLSSEDISIERSGELNEPDLKGSDIAYIIYTSGTTGKPKGVCVPHSALLNYVCGMQYRLKKNYNSYAHISAVDADLGNTSIFLALSEGNVLLFPQKETILNPGMLADFFRTHPADVLKAVPSHLQVMEEYFTDILPTKLLITGGEKLKYSLLNKIENIKPSLQVLNHYGPTETTIGVVTHFASANDSSRDIPIGSPLPNVDIVIIDKYHKPVPRGVHGEICIAGNNNSIGYLSDSDLNEDLFVRIPDADNKTYYRSGDRGFITHDDLVQFIGRDDRQVKISGHRLELQEIEQIAGNFPSVHNAVAFLNKENGVSKEVVLACTESPVIDKAELNRYLKRKLRDVFVPQLLILDSIPVTSNGKIDFDTLKEEFNSQSIKDKDEVSPRDNIELKLLGIFKEVLGKSNISISDNFFEIGGHSLLAIKLISRINSAFDVNLNISMLYNYGSVIEIAEYYKSIDNSQQSGDSFIEFTEKNQAISNIWIHPAGGNIMCYYPISREMEDFTDFYAFNADDHYTAEELSIDKITNTYLKRIKQKSSINHIVFGGWSMGGVIAHNMAYKSSLNMENVSPPVIIVDQPIPSQQFNTEASFEQKLLAYVEKVEIYAEQEIGGKIQQDGNINYENVLNEFVKLKLAPREIKISDFKKFLDLLIEHGQILHEYTPQVYSGPVLLIKASEQIDLQNSSIQSEFMLEDYGWNQYCSDLTIEKVPGNHITMMHNENAEHMATTIRKWLSTNDIL